MSVPKSAIQDKKAGLPVRQENGRYVTPYDPDIALKIVELIADGQLLKEICKPEKGMPHRSTFHRWVIANPPLAKAYNAAIALSASTLEEDALAAAREIKADPGNGTKVRAFEVAMAQFRWSASRRDPAKFGERQVANIRVPIQINTTLDLGDSGAGGTLEHPNIYGLTAQVKAEVPDNPDEPLIPPRSRKGKLILTPRTATVEKTDALSPHVEKAPENGQKPTRSSR